MEGLFDMAFTYPVTLNLTHKRCLVIGGGSVALRKVKSLLEEEALVEVVSPQLIEPLAELFQQERFIWHEQMYDSSYINDKFLVIAATDQAEVNHQAAVDCEDRGILINVVDDKDASNFIVNAHVSQGDLLLAVSTGGISPAISRKIKEQLQRQYGPEYAQMLSIVKEARQEAMATIADGQKRRAFLQSLAEMDLAEELKHTSIEDVQKRVRICLSSYWD